MVCIACAGDRPFILYTIYTLYFISGAQATDHPFRATGEEAMSYFVGAEAMNAEEYKGEDAGFGSGLRNRRFLHFVPK